MRKKDLRGYKLEAWLDEICAQINSLGFHAHKNHARRTHEGYYLEGEPFDYEFFVNGRVHCFDAKENYSGGDWWPIRYSGTGSRTGSGKILRQAMNLAACSRNGALGYFLVYFGSQDSQAYNKLICFDANLVYESIIKKIKRIHYSAGFEWDLHKIIMGEAS